MKIKYLWQSIALLAFLSVSTFMEAQTINGKPIQSIDSKYISIVKYSGGENSGFKVSVDFGQDTKLFDFGKHSVILDKHGNRMKFNSMIGALNFMSQFGYEFVQAYSEYDDMGTVHFIMEKTDDGSTEE